MQRLSLLVTAVFFVGLGVLAAETKPAEAKPVTGKAEAAVDRTVDKYKKADAQRFWVTPEFLMWWSKDGPVDGVIVGRTTDGSWPSLDNPVTRRLFNHDDQDYGMQLGGRLTFGMWVDDARKWGFELSGFALQEKSDRWSCASDGTADITAFSVFEVPAGTEGAWAVMGFGNPGSIGIASTSQLWGVGGSGLVNLKRSENLSLDATFGVRHLDLSESFTVTNRDVWAGEAWWQKDSFKTRNRFYGAKLGVKFDYTAWDRLLLSVEPSLALGANDEALKIRGATRVDDRSGPSGFYAMSTSVGDYSKAKFAVVPEIKVGLGCKITKNVSFMASYNFLYASNVVRPGQQVSRRRNYDLDPWESGTGVTANPAGTPREPAPRFKTTDYWTHGLGLNLKIQF